MVVAESGGQPHLVLISGPSRSGKSRWAEHLAASEGKTVLYLATGAPPGEDQAWAERVALHRQRRPEAWLSDEVGAELVAALQQRRDPGMVLLVDSLGTWVAHHLEKDQQHWDRLCEELCSALQQQRGPVYLVCEEVGWGVVPPTAIGGLFRDRMGAVQQRLAAICQQSWLVVAGRAMDVMKLGLPVPT